MRREDFTIELDASDALPTLVVSFSGTASSLRERLANADGRVDIDVAYRRTPAEESATDGVLGVTDRMTGEFIFEAATTDDLITALVDDATAASDDDDPSYRLRVDPGDDDPVVFEKSTLLVYNADGSLHRQDSLIPGSVEL